MPTPTSDDLQRALIIKEGKVAIRRIDGARRDAQKAWQAWRDLGTYVQPDGMINSRHVSIQQPAVKRSKDPTSGEVIEFHYMQQTGQESAEHVALRKIAEGFDIEVLDLQDQIDVYTALVPAVANRARR